MTIFRPGRRRNYIARWTDPETQKRQERSLQTHVKREAYQRAGELAQKVVDGITLDDPAWLEFCELYEAGHMRQQSEAHQEKWDVVKWRVERIMSSPVLSRITGPRIVVWQQKLRATGITVNTLASYSTYFRAALNWARKHDFLTRTPHIAIKREMKPRSRGITTEEFERILSAVPKVRKNDTHYWDRFLRGLSFVNLRVGELARLSWDVDAPIQIEHVGGYPMIRLAPQAHKSRTNRLQVIQPAFWEVCRETPESERTRLVFPIPNGRGGNTTRKRIIRIISDIGKKAGVVTNVDTRKTATSHDIGKKTFVRQIDTHLTPIEVHKTMGHAHFDTTMQFYETREASVIAAKLWAAQGASGALGGAAPKSPANASTRKHGEEA